VHAVLDRHGLVKRRARYVFRGRRIANPERVMSMPLDLQRKCEQRWLARFARPAPSAAPHRHQFESEACRASRSSKEKRPGGGGELDICTTGGMTRDRSPATLAKNQEP
jgi:hypothetical protein